MGEGTLELKKSAQKQIFRFFFFMEPTLVDSLVKGDGKLLELPNGLHQRQENGVKEKQARVFSRKRTRDLTPESVPKKTKQDGEQKLATQEERVNNLLGRTADILLVLAGLAQMRGGKNPGELEKQLAADAQSNLSSLVSRMVPGSLLTKGSSLDGMLGAMGFVKRADGSLEPAPRLQEAEKGGDDSDSDESSGSISGKDDGTQIQSGILTSPSALSLDDEAELDLKQSDDLDDFEDEQSQSLRHRQLSKLVQQLKAESYVPQPVPDVTNAYMITVVPCEFCQALVKDTISVVVCDGCEKVYHAKCLPQLHFRELPKGDWCCPRCNGVKPKYGPVNKASGGATPNKMPVRKPEHSKPGGIGGVTGLGLSNGPGEMNSSSTSNNNNNNNTSSSSSSQKVSLLRPEVEAFKAEQMVKAVEAGVAGASPAPGTLHVDWVGEVQRVVDRKAYYASCSVGGCTYKLQDCALFRPETPETPPYIARLQALWEDLDTGAKWVRVNWLYYPSDMPAAIAGRPETVEADEVFETNHSDNNLVGSIQGPCQVLVARKFNEEKERRLKLHPGGGGDFPPVFLCKWVYDAPKGEFRKLENA